MLSTGLLEPISPFIPFSFLENMSFLDSNDEKFFKLLKKNKTCSDSKNLWTDKENILYPVIFLFFMFLIRFFNFQSPAKRSPLRKILNFWILTIRIKNQKAVFQSFPMPTKLTPSLFFQKFCLQKTRLNPCKRCLPHKMRLFTLKRQKMIAKMKAWRITN